MTKIKLDERNYRIHGDKNKSLIRKSLEDLGAGRSIVLDNEDVIVAGNGVYEQASALGLKVRVIESDGTELIAIKRTDIATNDEKRKLLAIADNRTSDTSEFDFEMLGEDFDFDVLEELGFEDVDFEFDSVSETEDSKYTKKIESPTYEPKNVKPSVSLLVDEEKYQELINQISNLDCEESERAFLMHAAARFLVFDYELIADYYAHSEKETQEVMEKLALVIIDFDKALENGFVKLDKAVEQLYLEDNEK